MSEANICNTNRVKLTSIKRLKFIKFFFLKIYKQRSNTPVEKWMTFVTRQLKRQKFKRPINMQKDIQIRNQINHTKNLKQNKTFITTQIGRNRHLSYATTGNVKAEQFWGGTKW